jgi:hypothetical protein
MSKVRLLAVLAITMVAGLMVTGCKDQMGLPSDVGIAGGWDTRQVSPLYNGDDSVGTVTVWNTLDSLYVQYDVDGDQWLEKTDLSVTTRAGDIPQRDGNPGCGQFEFRNTWNEPRQSCTYMIPYRAGWGGKEICIATHCEETQRDCHGHETSRHNCWGGRDRFCGKDRCHYIKYRFPCVKNVDLPCGSVKMMGTYSGDVSYWTISLAVPGRDSLDWTGERLGWCVSTSHPLTESTWLDVRLWSTAIPSSLPTRLQNAGWDNVNYLLNHKSTDLSVTAMDIETSVLYLLGMIDYPPESYTLARQMIDDAVAHGDGWYPTSGEVIAVIAEPCDTNEQRCIIEVDP